MNKLTVICSDCKRPRNITICAPHPNGKAFEYQCVEGCKSNKVLRALDRKELRPYKNSLTKIEKSYIGA